MAETVGCHATEAIWPCRAEPASVAAMTTAFSTDQAKAAGIVVIIAVVVVGALLSFLVTKLTGRLVVAAVVVALGIFVWTQRADIEDAAKNCKVPTFFGIHLSPSKAVTEHCPQLRR